MSLISVAHICAGMLIVMIPLSLTARTEPTWICSNGTEQTVSSSLALYTMTVPSVLRTVAR